MYGEIECGHCGRKRKVSGKGWLLPPGLRCECGGVPAFWSVKSSVLTAEPPKHDEQPNEWRKETV